MGFLVRNLLRGRSESCCLRLRTGRRQDPAGRAPSLASAEQAGDTGYEKFIAGIDSVAMGRRAHEQALTFGPWPHDGRRVAVLSTRRASRAARVYVDRGQVIQTFLTAGLIQELTLTRVPLLLGGGLPLYGRLTHDLPLTHRKTTVLGAGMVQSTYATSDS